MRHDEYQMICGVAHQGKIDRYLCKAVDFFTSNREKAKLEVADFKK